jgi:hypothetical protein
MAAGIALDGDAPKTATEVGTSEAWFRVRLNESVSPSHHLTARLDLASPPGVDFDLFAWCLSCGGSLAGDSQAPPGELDTVLVGRADDGGDSSWDVLVEIRYYSGEGMCGEWTLTISTDQGALSCM